MYLFIFLPAPFLGFIYLLLDKPLGESFYWFSFGFYQICWRKYGTWLHA